MLNVYWWTDPQNFGDVLTPFILEHFNIPYKKTDTLEDAEAIMIGSTARLALDNQMVLGSGRIHDIEPANPNARWMWVRGPFTRENCIKYGCNVPKVYGDAALFLPEILPESSKQYEYGFIPHYSDKKYVETAEYDGKECCVIDLMNEDALDTARRITACKKIISSSLHGLIVAHAYGIPAAWVQISALWGSGVKFADHYASVKLKAPRIGRINMLNTNDYNAAHVKVEKAYFDAPDKIDMSNPREILLSL